MSPLRIGAAGDPNIGSNHSKVSREPASKQSNPPARQQLLLQRLCEIYAQNFSQTEAGPAMLQRLGIADFQTVARYGLGYSDGELRAKLPSEVAAREELETLGVIDREGAEWLGGRIIFPIRGLNRDVINLWAITPTMTPRFIPGRTVALWNITAARQAAEIYVSTDPIDALGLIAAGFSNTVALHPESGEPDVGTLRSLGVQRIFLVTGDTSSAATARIQIRERLPGWDCLEVVLPDTATVADFVRREGATNLAMRLRSSQRSRRGGSIPGLRPQPNGFSLTVENRSYEVRGLKAEGRRLSATFRVDRGDKWHIDTFDLNVSRARKEFIREVARVFEEHIDVITGDIGKLLNACETRADQPDFPQASAAPDPSSEVDRSAGEALGRDPRLIEQILEDFCALGVIGEDLNKILCYVAMTSRKQHRPLSVMFVSSSGAGKNTVLDAARDLCPPEERVETTNLSGKALFHLGAGALKNKLLTIDEREGAKHADYSLRVLISEARLITKVATKDPASGRLRTDTHQVAGPVAVLTTTTDPNTDAETKSRFIVASVDESIEQTQAIHAHQWRQRMIHGLSSDRSRSTILRRHHAFQRLLQPLPVVFASTHVFQHGDDRLRSRRDFPKALRLIEAVALLRQFQKPVKEHEGISYLEVDAMDLRVAEPLIHRLFRSTGSDLSEPSSALLKKIAELRHQGVTDPSSTTFVFTRREIRDLTGLPNTTLHRYLTELVEFEYLRRDLRDFGQRHRYCYDGAPADPGNGHLVPDRSASIPRVSAAATKHS